MAALELHFGFPVPRGAFYLLVTLTLELAGVAVLVGVGMVAYKRYVIRMTRLENRPGDLYLLVMFALIAVTGFLAKGLRLNATSDAWAAWTPVSYVFSRTMSMAGVDGETARYYHVFAWYLHAALAFILVASLPWTKMLHALAIPCNYLFSFSWMERAALRPPSPGNFSYDGTLSDCTAKQLMEADACIACGRCKSMCTMNLGPEPAAPVNILKKLRPFLHRGRFATAQMGAIIHESPLWSCSACRSCEDRCPMNGAHVERIVDIRRGVVATGKMPEEVRARFAANESDLAVARRDECGPQPGEELFIWPGCGEDQSITGRLIELVRRSGAQARLLEPPGCCGGPVRRLGNEALFRQNVAANLRYLRPLAGKIILTPCPHCYNTLTHEYPQFGGVFQVMHHTRYLAGLLANERLALKKITPLKVSIHDPCFLGRYNREFDATRNILSQIEGCQVIEMKHNRMKSHCCGFGGGTVTREAALASARERICQALDTSAAVLVTSCPYCRDNLAAAARLERQGTALPVMDIGELFDS